MDGIYPIKIVFIVVGEEDEDEENAEEHSKENLFKKVKEILPTNRAYDLCWRKLMRLNFQSMLHLFGSHPSLLNKQFTCLQLIVTDENRSIQEKLFIGDATIDPEDSDAAENSRHLFRVASSALLHETTHWVFSRSLVFKPFDGMTDEALEFTSYDPLGGLDAIKDVPVDDMMVTMIEAMKVLKDVPEIPLGVLCAEIIMFIAGDYAVDDQGLNSCEAVQKFMRELNTEEGILKVQGCAMMCGCSKTSPENIAVLKDVH